MTPRQVGGTSQSHRGAIQAERLFDRLGARCRVVAVEGNKRVGIGLVGSASHPLRFIGKKAAIALVGVNFVNRLDELEQHQVYMHGVAVRGRPDGERFLQTAEGPRRADLGPETLAFHPASVGQSVPGAPREPGHESCTV